MVLAHEVTINMSPGLRSSEELAGAGGFVSKITHSHSAVLWQKTTVPFFMGPSTDFLSVFITWWDGFPHATKQRARQKPQYIFWCCLRSHQSFLQYPTGGTGYP